MLRLSTLAAFVLLLGAVSCKPRWGMGWHLFGHKGHKGHVTARLPDTTPPAQHGGATQRPAKSAHKGTWGVPQFFKREVRENPVGKFRWEPVTQHSKYVPRHPETKDEQQQQLDAQPHKWSWYNWWRKHRTTRRPYIAPRPTRPVFADEYDSWDPMKDSVADYQRSMGSPHEKRRLHSLKPLFKLPSRSVPRGSRVSREEIGLFPMGPRDPMKAKKVIQETAEGMPGPDVKSVGCYTDRMGGWLGSHRAFKGGHKDYPPSKVVQKCYEDAKRNGVTFFAIQGGKKCFAHDKNAGDTYKRYGDGFGCAFGRGGLLLNDVYQIVDPDEDPDSAPLATRRPKRVGGGLFGKRPLFAPPPTRRPMQGNAPPHHGLLEQLRNRPPSTPPHHRRKMKHHWHKKRKHHGHKHHKPTEKPEEKSLMELLEPTKGPNKALFKMRSLKRPFRNSGWQPMYGIPLAAYKSPYHMFHNQKRHHHAWPYKPGRQHRPWPYKKEGDGDGEDDDDYDDDYE